MSESIIENFKIGNKEIAYWPFFITFKVTFLPHFLQQELSLQEQSLLKKFLSVKIIIYRDLFEPLMSKNFWFRIRFVLIHDSKPCSISFLSIKSLKI